MLKQEASGRSQNLVGGHQNMGGTQVVSAIPARGEPPPAFASQTATGGGQNLGVGNQNQSGTQIITYNNYYGSATEHRQLLRPSALLEALEKNQRLPWCLPRLDQQFVGERSLAI